MLGENVKWTSSFHYKFYMTNEAVGYFMPFTPFQRETGSLIYDRRKMTPLFVMLSLILIASLVSKHEGI